MDAWLASAPVDPIFSKRLYIRPLDFKTDETGYFHGTGFSPGTVRAIPFTHPDSSIVRCDGNLNTGSNYST
jgi:hypothetical protein